MSTTDPTEYEILTIGPNYYGRGKDVRTAVRNMPTPTVTPITAYLAEKGTAHVTWNGGIRWENTEFRPLEVGWFSKTNGTVRAIDAPKEN